ncbi:MAG: cytochrome c1 [Alphaproteobacteria bacterium TMED62]|nr:MAG: cytochrome c1 [Alphaproteobacteria bacterium TMED62]|tara:strand:- start:13293 stop:14045 length:753 start_codon:yes stop_codon:yes gene_type:complete
MKNFIIIFLLFSYTLNLFSAEEALKPEQYNFSFSKPLGKINKNSAQRGLQVFIEVCASCHGLKHVAYRSLEELGYNKDQVNSIAAQFQIDDLPNEEGEILKRKAIYSDYFVEPYKNLNEAKTANNGAYPPDLSLMVKARKDGANYVRSLLLGYNEPPSGFDVGEGYYNKYMAGNVIAMPQPLYGDDVEFSDGTKATLEQEVNDLVTFLTWTSMPDLENRRAAGIKVIFFLLVMTILFYISYRKIWSELKT